MENADKVVEEPVGTERRFLVEIRTFDIAAIGAPILDGTKLTIAVVFGEQFLIGDVVLTTIAKEPDVGLTSLFENSLEGQ